MPDNRNERDSGKSAVDSSLTGDIHPKRSPHVSFALHHIFEQ
jgi:hypothetical protein